MTPSAARRCWRLLMGAAAESLKIEDNIAMATAKSKM
jgi:hypothetical protein